MVGRWDLLKSSLLDASDKVCGTTKGPPRNKTSWWWNDTVEKAIQEKRKCCKIVLLRAPISPSSAVFPLLLYCPFNCIVPPPGGLVPGWAQEEDLLFAEES